ILYREYGDKVKRFIPINEAHSVCIDGYSTGVNAPGKKLHGIGEYLCIHNSIKAHARAYRIYEKEFKPTQHGEVGFMYNLPTPIPKNSSDILSAVVGFEFVAGWTLHPIYAKNGDYPEIMKEMIAAKSKQQGYARSRLPEFEPEWIDYIRGASDFLAVNHYTSKLMEPGESGSVPSYENDAGLVASYKPSWAKTASDWLRVAPEGFRYLLRHLATKYGNPPIYITENGYSDTGTNHDWERIQYYRDYLEQMLLAMYVDGVNVKGYYLWSLLDNFEWQRGYSERFGIVSVDFSDQNRTRTLKQSALWWQQVTAERKLPLSIIVPTTPRPEIPLFTPRSTPTPTQGSI
ncbi:myrosinase 1-like, partial [Hylaeus anthracinus]|uniref:myrosinase 1-like n=1 Tax=Hylaeus anthracinus TaxID=313031 RepID=UPI0023BA2D49